MKEERLNLRNDFNASGRPANGMPLVSIIIPTYNVEAYFDQCVQSVVNQTYEAIEIIVVLDGPTDGTPVLAERWAAADRRIVLLHQDNAGSGPARNAGIDASHGDFVAFVDPDDWVDEKMVESLIERQRLGDFDFVSAGMCKVDMEGRVAGRDAELGELRFSSPAELHNAYPKLLSKGRLGAPTRKLYRASLLSEHSIRFPDLRRSQDIVFNCRYCDKARSAIVVDDVVYYYRINPLSVHHKTPDNYLEILRVVYRELFLYCHSWGLDLAADENRLMFNYLFNLVVGALEGRIVGDCPINEYIDDEAVRDIATFSNPSRFDLRVIRKFLIEGNAVGVERAIRLRAVAKRSVRLIKDGKSRRLKDVAEGSCDEKPGLTAEKSRLSIEELQLEELRLLAELDKFCEKNGLTYYLSYGSLLGAVREGGFIPWDDDVDVCMTRDDYRALLKYDEIGEDCFLRKPSDPDSVWCYAKLESKRASFVEMRCKSKADFGVFIDIFPLDYLPDRGNFLRFRFIKNLIRAHVWTHATNLEMAPDRKFKKAFKLLVSKLCAPISHDSFVRLIDRFAINDEVTSRLINYYSPYRLNTQAFSLSEVESISKVHFSGQLCSTYKTPETHLERIYGPNWRTPVRDDNRVHGEAYWRA